MIRQETRVKVLTRTNNVYQGRLAHDYDGEGAVTIVRASGDRMVIPANLIEYVQENPYRY